MSWRNFLHNSSLEFTIKIRKNMPQSILSVYRLIFARPLFQRLNMLVFNLSLRGLGVLNYENDNVSGEKFFVNKVLPQVVEKKSPVLFDVGANVGRYTLSLLKTFADAQIYAFEPHPGNFSTLKKKCDIFGSKKKFPQILQGFGRRTANRTSPSARASNFALD